MADPTTHTPRPFPKTCMGRRVVALQRGGGEGHGWCGVNATQDTVGLLDGTLS